MKDFIYCDSDALPRRGAKHVDSQYFSWELKKEIFLVKNCNSLVIILTSNHFYPQEDFLNNVSYE
jgi:hypothetical protein